MSDGGGSGVAGCNAELGEGGPVETPGECASELIRWTFSDFSASVNSNGSTSTSTPLLLAGRNQERRLPPRTCTRMHPLQYLASTPVLNRVPIPTILRVLHAHIKSNHGYRGRWERKPAVGYFSRFSLEAAVSTIVESDLGSGGGS